MTKENESAKSETQATKTRKTPEERKAELIARLEAQEKRLESAREKKKKIEQKIKRIDEPPVNRKLETRKKILFGVTILEMMEKDEDLKSKVFTYLDAVVKKENDRKLLGLNQTDGPRVIAETPSEPFSFDNIKK